MSLLQPTPPPYDPLEWEKLPLDDRGRLACQSWAMQGYGTPPLIYIVYLAKIGLYILGWAFFCSLSPSLGPIGDIGSWWLEPVAFQKAILWSMLFEVLGLGCGSGPLTGRYVPPVGGFLYFLRPGTTKLPGLPGAPVVGTIRRTWLDVGLYAALLGLLVTALMADAPPHSHLLALAILVPVIWCFDRTIFLALRSEHYWVTVVVFVVAGDWIAGAKAVQLALWFWAGVSKLNHHFPTVVCVMMSNSPWTPFERIRKLAYRKYPEDLRPSRFATIMGHAGTTLELGVPMVLGFAAGPTGLFIGMILMLMLHGYITSNVPMGVPLEWNVMVVYGAFALFWAHPEVSAFDVGSVPLGAFLLAMLVGLPLLGNLLPHRLSFLLSMRYYAGNWAYSAYLFEGDAADKLGKLTKSTPWIYEQLDRFYEHSVSVGLVSKVLAFRMMHLHGRALTELIPKAVERFEDYQYMDGEIVAGAVLGWNFGDGHLHDERLIAAMQAQCEFEPGELRCILVESQPLGGDSLTYRIVDAATGEIERGRLPIQRLRERQPWELA